MALTLWAGRTGIRPEPDDARRWLEQELDKAPYQEGLVQRFSRWLDELLQSLQDAAAGAGGLSVVAAIVLTVALLALIGLVLSRVSREAPAGRAGPAGVIDATVTADEHRRLAEQALADGDSALALVEAFRAIAARAVQRAVLVERPDLTAHELVDELRPRFPEQTGALERAALLFDLVFYGDQPASVDDAREVLDLEAALRRARPVSTGDSAAAPGLAVPR